MEPAAVVSGVSCVGGADLVFSVEELTGEMAVPVRDDSSICLAVCSESDGHSSVPSLGAGNSDLCSALFRSGETPERLRRQAGRALER